MDPGDGNIQHVSDTALMVAACRALEIERPDGFVKDPFAARLAGDRGMRILQELPRAPVMCFGVGIRSLFMDELVRKTVHAGAVDAVLSVGCGLDTRPWRLDLPPTLRWIEVDFPDMLEYKSGLLASETPNCRVEHVAADLTDAGQRERVWASTRNGPALMITEGLLMYLPGATVQALAAEAPRAGSARYWLTDITSPAFARLAGLDTFREVQNVRADTSMDGLQILGTLQQDGWRFSERRSYLTDIWAVAGERLRAMAEARKKSGAPEEPQSPVPPDDPTGVHLFAYEA